MPDMGFPCSSEALPGDEKVLVGCPAPATKRMQLINPDAITKMCNCKAPLLLQTEFLLLSCHHCLAEATLLPCVVFLGAAFGVWLGLVAAESTRLGRLRHHKGISQLLPAPACCCKGRGSSAETRSCSWWCTVIFR